MSKIPDFAVIASTYYLMIKYFILSCLPWLFFSSLAPRQLSASHRGVILWWLCEDCQVLVPGSVLGLTASATRLPWRGNWDTSLALHYCNNGGCFH